MVPWPESALTNSLYQTFFAQFFAIYVVDVFVKFCVAMVAVMNFYPHQRARSPPTRITRHRAIATVIFYSYHPLFTP